MDEFNHNLIRAKSRKAQKSLLSEVPNWPVLDLGVGPNLTKESWRLFVTGEVKNPYILTRKQLLALPQIEDISDFHCVTTWSRMDNHWKGVQFKVIAEKAQLKLNAQYVYITGYDGYSTNLKLEEALDEDVLLVHTWEGRDLPKEHGGPVRMIVPRKYAWKGSKWIREMIFHPEEKLGFWELRGYSNSAEPWYDDRYAPPQVGI